MPPFRFGFLFALAGGGILQTPGAFGCGEACGLEAGISQSPYPELAVPAVDLKPLLDADSNPITAKAAMRAIEESCSEIGIFRPLNHGIAAETLLEAMAAHRQVFALPKSEKQKLPISGGGFTRGYVPLGSESGSATRLECKEAFSYGHEWRTRPGDATAFTNPLQGPNAWPASLNDASRAALGAWYNASVGLSLLVASGLSDAMGLDGKAIRDLCDGGETISLMRLFRYVPEVSDDCADGAPAGTERIGSSPHTDWGFLTLIYGDGGPGLQVERAGEWHELDAAARSSPIIVCGDYLSLMATHVSAGPEPPPGHRRKLKSPIHRVLLPASDSRASFVFFYYPNYNANFASEARRVVSGVAQGASGADGTSVAASAPVNTMLDLANADPAVLELPFGEYIRRKWGKVFKA